MSAANPNYSFNISQENDSHSVQWKSAKLGNKFALPLIWIAAIVSLVISLLTMENNSSGVTNFLPNWITWFILLYAGTILLMNFMIRRGGSFSFNKEGFKVNGQQYPNKDIQGIYVRSPKGEKVETLTYTTYHGFGVAGAVNNTLAGVNQISGQARMALMRAIRDKSYAVCIQYGEREIYLAKGLTYLTAKAMLNKIDELV